MELNFDNGAFAGAAAGAVIGYIWLDRPWYGATYGVLQAAMAIGIKTLLGKTAFYVWIGIQGMVHLGKVGSFAHQLQLRENAARLLKMITQPKKNPRTD